MALNSPSIDIQIRPMRIDDIDQVVVIDHLSFSLPWPDNAYRHEVGENPASLSWVAEIETACGETKICGMVVIWLILDETHIATLAVHPDYRDRGIGKRLLGVALEASAEQGAQLATLEVREGNQVAQKIYRDFGFQIVGRRQHYYKDNFEDAVLMTLQNLRDFDGLCRVTFEKQ
jgi:ribosomal-protein-alanine N-acetyltransferase